MPYNLIPFPISIIFVFVFGLAIVAILLKLRKRGKIFSILFYLSLIIGIIVLVLLSYSVVSSLIHAPYGSSNPRPTIVLQPSILKLYIKSFLRLF
jgi:hypothetical protein